MKTSRPLSPKGFSVAALLCVLLINAAASAGVREPLQAPANLALKKPAQQSSTSSWSNTNDAQGGVDGIKNGSYGFHTDNEKNPWWQVDLQSVATLKEVRVFNRMDVPGRAETIQVLLSTDGKDFDRVYPPGGAGAVVGAFLGAVVGRPPAATPATPPVVTFGGTDGKPLVVDLKGAKARYVRLQLNTTSYFHLDEVEVYGTPGTSAQISQNVSAPIARTNVAGQGATGNITGLWTWACCGGRNSGMFAIVEQNPNGTIVGQFSRLNPDDDGAIEGRVNGDQIEFTRRGVANGRAFAQRWTARIETTGNNRKMTGGIADQANPRQSLGDFTASSVANATMTTSIGGVSQTPFIPGIDNIILDGGLVFREIPAATAASAATPLAQPVNTPVQPVALPATGSGTFTLARIEVTRKYPQGWTADNNVYRSGTQTLTADQRSLRHGWDFTWGDGKQNRNRAMADLQMTEVPAFVEPGEDASFAAKMQGEWITSGYGVGRDRTVRLTGALGIGQYRVDVDPNGSQQGSFETRNKATVPAVENGVVVVKSTATVRFGDDHVGDMEIRLVYEPARGRTPAVTTNAAPPPVVVPVASVAAAPVATPPVTTPPAPAAPQPSPNAVGFSFLAFDLRLDEANNNKVLDGGERFNIRVSIRNTGTAAANDVQVRLAGDATIVSAAGTQKPAGNIAPGATQIVDFNGQMPLQVTPRNAEIRISLFEGATELPQGQVLRVGLAPSDVKETTTTVSEVVDVDYPPAPVPVPERNSSVAVIVGIGNYRESGIPKLPYAGRDAETFAKYIENIGGVRRENIKILADDRATRSDIEDAIEQWLPLHVTETSHVYFYYAGHGALDPSTGDTYLVPYEGSPDSPSTRMYPLKRLYEKLGALKVQNVTAFLDSCFSGGGRSIAMTGRPILIAAPTSAVSNNVTVLAAAGPNQVSSDYERTKHGLFTYFLLKGMRGEADTSRDGWIDLGELAGYVRDRVRSTAATELSREQTPVLNGGLDLDAKRATRLFKFER